MSSMFWASRRKSSSSTIVSAKSSTSAGGLESAVTGIRPTSMGRDPRHGGDVEPHQRGDGPALHLHDHPFAGPQGRGVDLGDRCRGDRGAVEGDEDLGERATEILFDRAPDGGERLGRDPVAQQPELVDELLGEDALTGGEDLAELDVGRPEALEGRAQTPRKTGPRPRECPARGGPSASSAHPRRNPTASTRVTEGRCWGPDQRSGRARPPASAAGRCRPRRPPGTARPWSGDRPARDRSS